MWKYLPVLSAAASFTGLEAASLPQLTICPSYSSSRGHFAAAQLRRFLWHLGQNVARIGDERSACSAAAAENSTSTLISLKLVEDSTVNAESFTLHRAADAPNVVELSASSESGLLYATSALLERMGVRFGLTGPVLPTHGMPLDEAIPVGTRITASPVFDRRGLQPFHDFYEGPDTWSQDAWAAVAESVAMMKGNTIALHTYPYNQSFLTGTNEPTVWVGTADAVLPSGDVTPSGGYPTSWANTLRSEWGYQPINTSAYVSGASQLYAHECSGHDLQAGNASRCPWPVDAASSADLFNDVGRMFQSLFSFWNGALGVSSVIGTETPLSLPPSAGQQNASAQAYYEGIFTRLMRLYGSDLDTYWVCICTSGCYWRGPNSGHLRFINDSHHLALPSFLSRYLLTDLDARVL